MDIKHWFTVGNIVRLLPYAFLLTICLIIVAIGCIGYICYRVVKLNIFRHTIYIPYKYPFIDVKKMISWINENINGRCCIEEDIQPSDWMGPHHNQDILLGWHVRFTKITDAMAFKLVWYSKHE